MVKHIVFFKLSDIAEGKSRIENALIIKQELENLKNLIPQIRKIEVGINLPEADAGNYDISLYSEFDSMEDLDAYIQHPEHKRVGAYIVSVRTDRVAVDYEV